MQKLLFAAFCGLAFFTASCSNENPQSENNAEAQSPSVPPQSSLNEAGTEMLMTVVSDYYELKDALVATNAAKADAAAGKLTASADSMKIFLGKDSMQTHTELTALLDTISKGSRRIVDENDETTEKKRVHFEDVSDAMYALLQKAELKNAGVYRQYCPMAFDDKGAYWLSHETEIRNPYFGKKMLECGEVTDSLK